MIKNLLFDLGGVIMNLDRNRCVKALEALGLAEADEMLGIAVQKGPFGQLESGQIGPDEFRNEIRARIGRPVSDSDIDGALNRFLLGTPVQRLHQLRQLRERYGVYMLSNTNPIMWNSFIADQFRQEGREVGDYFDGIVTSFEARCMKPSAEIFDYAARTLGIAPGETLFLDDAEVNCRAAEALGWHAALVAPGREFMDILHEQKLI